MSIYLHKEGMWESVDYVDSKKTFPREKRQRFGWLVIAVNLVIVLSLIYPSMAEIPETINGIYLPPQPRKRMISEAIFYAELEHLNAVVLHVKDPRGWIYWQSRHPIAREIGAVHYRSPVERNVKRLNREGIWTIAKIDIFQDSLLAKKYPEMGVLDTQSGGLWANKKGLHRVNGELGSCHANLLIVLRSKNRCF